MENRIYQTKNIILNIIKRLDDFLYTFGNKIL